MRVRIGTRDSELAMTQTRIVAEYIKKYDENIEIEIIPMKTTGDKILDVALDKIGGKGLFVKELDDALYENRVDITVHSFKDMPMGENPDLPIVAISKREDPRDVLITKGDKTVDRETCVVGTSSKRREVQLREMGYRNIIPIRGNIFTRLRKLDEGEFDAIVLAAAGIKRSGLESRIKQYFTIDEMIPAACQGNLAVQGRRGEDFSFLKYLHDEEASIIAKAERAFVTTLDGGCSVPIAAYGLVENHIIKMTGMYVSLQGEMFIEQVEGDIKEAITLGISLAEKILTKGIGIDGYKQ